MEGLENIISFFKHTQTKGHKLYDLYKKYCYSSYPKISQEQFENAVVFMDKWVIRELKKKCAKYTDYGIFIQKEELITRKLWNHLKGIKEKYPRILPEPFLKSLAEESSKIVVVEQAIKNGATKFSDIVLKTGMFERTIRKKIKILIDEGKIKATGKASARRFFPGSVLLPPLNMTSGGLPAISQKKPVLEDHTVFTFIDPPDSIPPAFIIPEVWSKLHWIQKEKHIKATKDPKFLESIMKVETIRIVQDACIKRGAELGLKIFPPRLKKPGEPDYESMLPINWDSMTRGERVDYAQKVQHKGLFNYVMSIDKSLKSYMDSVRKNKSASINLYVNLFSFSSSNTSEEAKALIKSFVEALNMMGRARLQYVEIKEPPLIEIREVRK